MTIKNLVTSDGVFEIHQNHFISHNPYLLRAYSYNNNIEIRMNNKDLKELVNLINSVIEESDDSLQLER